LDYDYDLHIVNFAILYINNDQKQFLKKIVDLRSTSSRPEEFITTEEGKAMAKKVGASFCETSSLHLIGLNECFSAAVGPVNT
jgi:hypothetical protein